MDLMVVPVPAIETMSSADVAEWMARPDEVSFPVRTFRGRYCNVDAAVAELGDWAGRPSGSTVRILDIGGGILANGSPTAHDLHFTIERLGLRPEIVVVDVAIPETLQETRSGISYVNDLKNISGCFDVVRILNVLEHVTLSTYAQMRNTAWRHLRDGGFFVATQEAAPEDHRNHARHIRAKSWEQPGSHVQAWYTPNTKVAQRRGGQLVPVGLYPALIMGFNEGRIALKDRLEEAIERLTKSGPRSLDHECAGYLHASGRLDATKWNPMERMAQEARRAPEYAVAVQLRNLD